MKYRNRFTGGIIEASVHVGDYADLWKGDVCLGVSDGDRIFRLPDGAWEKAPADHPMWADYDEIVETRVVKVEVGKTTTYHAERLTERGWVRGSAKATQALAEVDVPVKPVETIVRGVVAK